MVQQCHFAQNDYVVLTN